ncbi:MAG: hypothetical protein WCG85_04050 [Polyangia bacterium]
MSRLLLRLTLLLVLSTFVQPKAHAAEDSSVVPACPAGNLLAGKLPVAWQEIARDRALLTDETVANEGAVWDASLAALFETGASTVTWDLGEVVRVRLLAIQADANDTYNIWGSLDGKDYKVMGQIDPVTGHGLRMRTLDVGGMAARFLRVGEGKGDGSYSVSEVAAYCQTPTPFPPQFKVLDAPAATAPKSYLDYWNTDTSARWEMILAILAAILLWWERRLTGLGMAAFKLRLRRILLGTMGVLAFLSFFNFGFWHFPGFVHGWDTFHYYIGSKYFKEMHYERLYECVATADSEEPGLRRRVELRKITNLRTNVVEKTDDILVHPERCKQHFTDARWESFKNDLRYFRTLEGPRRWDDAQCDHGFNGTPVWAILGSALANLAPASRLDVLVLDAIDVAMIVAMALLMWWAFGWRTVSVAFLVLATNFPSRWDWIGGSFLRFDWLFWMGVGVCLMKKDWPFWAGVALAYAALLRIFPGFLFVAPLIALGYHYVKARQWDRRLLRLIMGAAVAVAVLVPVSFATSGGPSIYPEFLRNTAKHSETPLTNLMGLRTVVHFRPAETAGRLNTPSMVDQWSRWKQARLKAFHEALPLYVSLVLCYLVLVGLAIRKVEPWVTVLLSATVISFGSELTGYYYAFLIIPALLYAVVPRAGEWLLWLTALTQFLCWAPIKHFPNWLQSLLPSSVRQSSFIANFSMPNGMDEQHTWMSLATLVVFVLIARELMRTRQSALVSSPAEPESKPGQEEKQPLAAPISEPVLAQVPRPPVRKRKRR